MTHQEVNLQWELKSKRRQGRVCIWINNDFSYKIYLVLASCMDGTGQGIFNWVTVPAKAVSNKRGGWLTWAVSGQRVHWFRWAQLCMVGVVPIRCCGGDLCEFGNLGTVFLGHRSTSWEGQALIKEFPWKSLQRPGKHRYKGENPMKWTTCHSQSKPCHHSPTHLRPVRKTRDPSVQDLQAPSSGEGKENAWHSHAITAWLLWESHCAARSHYNTGQWSYHFNLCRQQVCRIWRQIYRKKIIHLPQGKLSMKTCKSEGFQNNNPSLYEKEKDWLGFCCCCFYSYHYELLYI